MKSDNVVEIAKDRDGGVQDEFIPLYFERESKRMKKNSTYECKTYGWQTESEEFIELEDLPDDLPW